MLYTYSMLRIFLPILTALLVGCSGIPTTEYRVLTPYEVSIIPVDCYNKKHIVAWLEDQLKWTDQFPRLYNDNIDAIKFKLWEIRTHCPR
jgi:hypothetical protein